MTASTIHPWAATAADRVRFGIETALYALWPVLRAFA
jgi:hypothetical protein